jgi:hypothetical protein
LLAFIQSLDQAAMAYELDSVRDAIMVRVAVPGERWEVEFFEDGDIEIERFVSAGVQQGTAEMLDGLIAEYSD